MIKIHTPTKKTDYYVSKISYNNSVYNLTLNSCNFIQLIEQNENTVMRLWINPDNKCHEILNDFETEIINNIIQNNSKWFKNDLPEELIKKYFKKSIDSSNTLIITSLSAVPPVITYNNKTIETLNDVNLSSNMLLNVTISPIGLYFLKQKCGIRWKVKNIIINDQKEENDIELYIPNNDIINDWNEDINNIINEINEDINNINEQKNKLEILKYKFAEAYKNSLNEKNHKIWNKKFENIAQNIAKYKAGNLDINNFIFNTI